MSKRMIALLFSLLLAAPAYASTVPIVVIGDTVAAPSGTANSVEWRHKTTGVASGDTLQSGGKTFQRDGTGTAVKLNDSAAANPTAKIVRQALACDAPNGIFNGQCKPPCTSGFSWDAAGTCECPAPKTVTAGVCTAVTTKPTVTASFTPTSDVVPAAAVTLNWSTTLADTVNVNCTGAQTMAGAVALSGSQAFANLTATESCTVSATNVNGTTTVTAKFTAMGAPPPFCAAPLVTDSVTASPPWGGCTNVPCVARYVKSANVVTDGYCRLTAPNGGVMRFTGGFGPWPTTVALPWTGEAAGKHPITGTVVDAGSGIGPISSSATGRLVWGNAMTGSSSDFTVYATTAASPVQGGIVCVVTLADGSICRLEKTY